MRSLLHLTLDDVLPESLAADAVGQVVTAVGGTHDQARNLRTMVGQLVAEARLREAFTAGPADVQVQVSRDTDRLIARVSDRRLPTDDGPNAAMPSWLLARQGCVDGLQVASDHRGNLVECHIHIAEDPAWLGEPQGTQIEVVDAGTAAATTIREGTPADARQIARLTFRCYGFSYPATSMYGVDALQRSLTDGQLTSTVAVHPDGDVVGHASIAPDGLQRVPEYGRMMVDPRYRGHHLAERITEVAFANARIQGVPGVWAECVANHRAAQQLIHSEGGIETGLFLGVTPSGVTMAGFDKPLQAAMPMVATYVRLQPAAGARAYLPEHLIDNYQELVDRLGLPREVSDTDTPPTGPAVVEVGMNQAMSSAVIYPRQPGENGASRVAEEFEHLARQDFSLIYLDIPLAFPSAPRAIRMAERFGFFWAALLPGAHPDGDILRLQRPPLSAMHPQGLALATSHGARMADFVLTEGRRVGASNKPR